MGQPGGRRRAVRTDRARAATRDKQMLDAGFARQYRAGRSGPEISRESGVGIGAVYRRLRADGITLRAPGTVARRRRMNADLARALATRVRAFRINAGLSVATLEARSGVACSTVRHIERARIRPTLETLSDLAIGLGRSLDELVVGLPTGRSALPRPAPARRLVVGRAPGPS